MSWRRWLVVALSFGFALAISGHIVWSGWASHGAPRALPWWAHLAAFTAVLGEMGTRAVKMHWSAASLRIPLSFGAALRTCLGGDFAASITPARSGAEPARFLVLAEAGLPAASILLVLFTELFLEIVSLVITCIVLAVVFEGSGRVVGLLIGVVGGYATFVATVGVVGWVLAFRYAKGPPPPLVKRLGLHAGRWRRIQRSLRTLKEGLTALRHARVGWMIAACSASVLHVLLRLAVLPVIVLSVAPETPLAPLVLWPLVLLYGSSVAPAPGGGGAVEYSFKLALGSVLLASLLAGSLLWWRFYTFYLYILIGALAAGGTVLRALRSKPEEILDEAPAAS